MRFSTHMGTIENSTELCATGFPPEPDSKRCDSASQLAEALGGALVTGRAQVQFALVPLFSVMSYVVPLVMFYP